MNERRVGFTPVPDDADLKAFFTSLIKDDTQAVIEIVDELRETVIQTTEDDEPEVFAYGKLLNYLTSLDKNSRVHLLSAALWYLRLEVIETDGNGAQV